MGLTPHGVWPRAERVGWWALAALLFSGPVSAEARAQSFERAPTRLVGARIEAVLEPEGDAARVTLSFRLASSDPEVDLTLLAIASPSEFQEVEASTGDGWSPLRLEEVAAGRLEGRWGGRVVEGGDTTQLTVRYRVPSAQVRASDGSVTGLWIPVLAPLGVAGESASGAVEFLIRSGAPIEVSRPFPSGLEVRDDPRGWALVGVAPAVPGVVRFGEHNPETIGIPRHFPGGAFWGLWLALGALLMAYVAWVWRAETRSEGEGS